MAIAKIKRSLMVIFLITILFNPVGSAQGKSDTSVNAVQKGSADYFTGNVWVNMLATDTTEHWSIAKVMFEKNARSNWHYHTGKQVLVITEGIGYLKEKDKPLQTLRKGDVATIQPGVLHWHGATSENEFTQIVINPNIEKGVVNWLEKVTDDEYRNSK